MTYFRDESEIYELIGALLRELARDPELAPRFRHADTVVQWQYRDPDAQITARIREGAEIQVDCGPTELEPEVTIVADADIAHRFWLGRLNVTVALARGQMRARGPVIKVLKLLPLLKPAFSRYRALLEAAGRGDLVNAA